MFYVAYGTGSFPPLSLPRTFSSLTKCLQQRFSGYFSWKGFRSSNNRFNTWNNRGAAEQGPDSEGNRCSVHCIIRIHYSSNYSYTTYTFVYIYIPVYYVHAYLSTDKHAHEYNVYTITEASVHAQCSYCPIISTRRMHDAVYRYFGDYTANDVLI